MVTESQRPWAPARGRYLWQIIPLAFGIRTVHYVAFAPGRL